MVNTSLIVQPPERPLVRRQLLRRSLGLGALAGGAALASGCSLFPSSSKAKLPELPALAGNRLAIAWRAPHNGGGFGMTPAFAAGSIFSAGRDGVISRRDAASGRLLWSINAGVPLVTGVGSDGELVVVASRDGRLLAFDGQGKARWTHALTTEAASVPAVAVGVVVVRTSDNKTIGLDAESGRRRWIFSRQNAPVVVRQTHSVAIDGASTFVGLPGGRMVALSLQNGAVRWEAAVSNPRGATEIERINDVLGTPLISGRDICASSYQGRVSCFEVSSGRPQWSREWQAVGGVELDARNLYASDARGHVSCMSRASAGNPVWTQESLKGRELTGPMVLGGLVLVGDNTGLIHGMSSADGSLVGRLAGDGSAVVGSGVSTGELAVFQTSSGELLAISVR